MPEIHAVPPADLRYFLEALASAGISATLPTAGPDDLLPDPLSLRTSLTAAVLQERNL